MRRILPGAEVPASLPAMKVPALPAWLLCSLLIGCALVDQTTFAPPSQAKTGAHPAAQAAAPPASPNPGLDKRIPLVTIGFDAVPADYQGLLRQAVHAAEVRDPAVQYDVIGLAKTPADAPAAQAHATEVMRAIMTERVPAARIHLGLRTEAGVAADEVRVYVR
jgi:hypothetical protein